MKKCSECQQDKPLDEMIFFQGNLLCYDCDAKITAAKHAEELLQQSLQQIDPIELRAGLFLNELTSRCKNDYVNKGFIAVNMIIFAIMAFSGVPLENPGALDLIPWGAADGSLITQGENWRLLTGTFLHYGYMHLLMNMFFLWFIGSFCEKLIGHSSYFIVYLTTALGGSLCAYIMAPLSVGAGASGAGFGVYGALLGVIIMLRRQLPAELVQRFKFGTLIFLALNIVEGIRVTEIGLSAHLGGFVCGFFCGLFIADYLVLGARQRRRQTLLLVLICTGALLVWANYSQQIIQQKKCLYFTTRQ